MTSYGSFAMVTSEEERSCDKVNESIDGSIGEVLPGGLAESPAEKTHQSKMNKILTACSLCCRGETTATG